MPFTHLLSPVELAGGEVTLRNRVTMSALTRNRSIPTSVPNEVNLEYYTQRAAGGAGLIVTEGTLITQQGTEWQNAPGIWNAEQVEGWKKITESVHKHGAKIFCQLWHLGRVSHPDAPEQKASGEPVYAPSAISARGGKFRFLEGHPGYVTPTELPDPRTIIEKYKLAAINAKEAGFDGVELHGANGYLVHQFLDSSSNQRTDSYGGSVENRCRFGLEVLDELYKVWGKGRVSVKLSPCGGYNDLGMPLEDTLATYNYFIKEADTRFDLAYFCLVRYAAKLDSTFDGVPRGTNHDVIASYRPSITKSSLIVNADLTAAEADGLIASKTIDAACFGWSWIANPDFTKRIEQGVELEQNVDFGGLYNPGAGLGDAMRHDMASQRKGYSDYPFATDVKL